MRSSTKKNGAFRTLLDVLMVLAALYALVVVLVLSFKTQNLPGVDKNEQLIKILAFWGLVLVCFFADMFLIGLTRRTKAFSIYAFLLIWVIACWIIYGLMFGVAA